MNAIELKKEQKFESLSTRDTNLATVSVTNGILLDKFNRKREKDFLPIKVENF